MNTTIPDAPAQEKVRITPENAPELLAEFVQSGRAICVDGQAFDARGFKGLQVYIEPDGEEPVEQISLPSSSEEPFQGHRMSYWVTQGTGNMIFVDGFGNLYFTVDATEELQDILYYCGYKRGDNSQLRPSIHESQFERVCFEDPTIQQDWDLMVALFQQASLERQVHPSETTGDLQRRVALTIETILANRLPGISEISEDLSGSDIGLLLRGQIPKPRELTAE